MEKNDTTKFKTSYNRDNTPVLETGEPSPTMETTNRSLLLKMDLK
jgi:hypothetical protein